MIVCICGNVLPYLGKVKCQQQYHVTTFGVTRNSLLNSLHNFLVTESLVPDIMNDLLE